MSKKTIVAPESKVKTVTIEQEQDQEPDTNQAYDRLSAHRRALQKYEQKQQLTNPIEELAQNIHGVVGNVKFPGADEAFPLAHQGLLRFCSKVYPYAKGGALYVDYPKNEVESYRAWERNKVMKKLKLRHVVVEKDSSLIDLLEQLGEI